MSASDFAGRLAELTYADSVFEAESLVRRLSKEGITAIAVTDPEKFGVKPRIGQYHLGDPLRVFVLVPTVDLARAKAMLTADIPPEGPADSAAIVRQMDAMTEDEVEAALDEDYGESWSDAFERSQQRYWRRIRTPLLLLVFSWIAWRIFALLR